jgi:hypothetical protein
MPSGTHKRERSHQKYRLHAGEPTVWRRNPLRRFVPFGGGARQEALPHARRCTGMRRAKGKPERAQARSVHQDAIAERRQIQALLGEASRLLEEIR